MRKNNLSDIGLMLDPLNGYASSILNGISNYIHSVNPPWKVSYFDRERKDLAELVRTWQGDGIICTVVDDNFLDAVKSREIPIVNVVGRYKETGMMTVISDDPNTGAMGARFFLERGFRRLAFVRSRVPEPFAIEREEGFVRTARAAGAAVVAFQTSNDIEADLTDWLRAMGPPLGLMAATDRIALEILHACSKQGLAVPEQFSVLGCGNHTQLCELCSPQLSSVDVDFERRGYEAAELLQRVLTGEEKPTSPVMIPPLTVRERASTDAFAFDDEDMVAALRFIRSKASETIQAKDVVAATSLSRRSLEMRFQKLLGRTIHDEIWRVHFEVAQHLLSVSDLGLEDIAARAGFSSASTLANLFRLRTGMTPRTYRAKHRR